MYNTVAWSREVTDNAPVTVDQLVPLNIYTVLLGAVVSEPPSTYMQSLYTRTQLTDLKRLYRKSKRKEARLNNKLRPLRTQLFRLEPELMRVIHEENTRNGATQAGKRRKPRHTRKKRRRN